MKLPATSPDFPARLARACLVALYSAIALLGSGGLHAVAPKCSSTCCAAKPEEKHAHRGCTHHHHTHSHATGDSCPAPENTPAPCPEGCLICEFAATPAVVVTLVATPPVLEAVGELAPPAVPHLSAETVACFWIRGPPAC